MIFAKMVSSPALAGAGSLVSLETADGGNAMLVIVGADAGNATGSLAGAFDATKAVAATPLGAGEIVGVTAGTAATGTESPAADG